MNHSLYILLIFPFFILGQSVDSLKQSLKKANHDTTRCHILSAMIEAEEDDALWPEYNKQLNQLAKRNAVKEGPLKNFYLNYLASSYSDFGYLANLHGHIQEAIEYYNKGMRIQEELGNKKELTHSLNNIGFMYSNLGDISNALKFYNKSLKIREEIGDKYGIAATLNNIAFIYNSQNEVSKAMELMERSLAIREEIGDKEGIANSLNNLGVTYNANGDYVKGLAYYQRGLAIQEEIGDTYGVAYTLNNIGGMYQKQGNYEKALEYYERSLKAREEMGDKEGVTISYIRIAKLLFDAGKYREAFNYAKDGLKLAKELGFPENIKNSASTLKLIYEKQHKYKEALAMFELFTQMRDSLNNLETQKATIKQQTEYDYQKKKAIDDKTHEIELRRQEENAIAEKNKQNIIISSVSIVLLLVALFSIFLYNRFKVTQRQKIIIEQKEKETQLQKEIIEEKHKEITDSINYAERIQRSFLATKEQLDQNLKNENYFVFFKPKDVVSGDFYWASKLKNGNFAFVTADSTGHGVPGAIMSLLNITSLEKAVEQTSDPSEILNLTRKIIIERLKNDGSPEGGKDGMDCSILSIDREKKRMEIASANNPVWIIRHGEGIEKPSLVEVKTDKMPVGKNDRDQASFSTHKINLQKGDVIYTLTDGFPDQFGGSRGKKFMSKKLKELLMEISNKSMNDQRQILDATFVKWVGDLEQVDDVTIVGIKV